MPQRRQATRRFLATVLFTDIVGSTERAAELGDRAWRGLLDRHHAVVRRELRAFHGREMGTSGDGFLALFEAPERAVSCAESIAAAVESLGLQVRAGVHTGECEVVGGEIGGMAVHIGSRVAALAGPGEVLVTGSVRDLMTGSDRHFTGGEPQPLKGVAEPWPVYRLVSQPVNGDTVGSRRPPMLPMYKRGRRRSAALAAAIVAALAVSTVGYLVLRPGPGEEVVVGENAVGVIGPGDPPRFDAAVPVGRRPTGMASGFGSVWVTNSTDDSVSRIDPQTRTAVAIPVGPPGSSPSGVAVGEGAVWVANSGNATVTRLDPTTSRPTHIPVQPGPTGIVVAFGSVWVTNALDASVTEIDPDTSAVAGVVPVGAGPTGIAAGAGYLWVTNQGDGTVTRFDPRTSVPDSPVNVGDGPVGIAVSRDAAWVTDSLDGSLSRIDVDTLNVTARTLIEEGGAYGVATRGDDVWVSNEYAGSLMRVTAEKDFRLSRTVPLDGAPLGLAYVGEDLWFTNATGGSALHRGGVLTMVGPGVAFPDGDDPPVLDPTVGYDPASWRLTFLAYDGLVGVRRAGGVPGANIVADLATSLPEPTDGGLTYTFHLRKGVRYSTGAPVLAGDIRRGIERNIMDANGAGYVYYGAIVGGKACKKDARVAVRKGRPLPDCDLSKGIEADDSTGTISFHLRKPVPEFVYQLSLLSGVAVPQDTPTELQPGEFLPATGPYMIESYRPKKDAADGHGRLVLVRNPHFREWSSAAQPAGYPARIVLDTGYTHQEGIAHVVDGRADLLWFGVTDGDVDRLRARYPLQTHTNPGAFVGHVFLNTTKPPFDNPRARRAFAFALDRRALADLSMGQPTCQLVPPDFPAHKPYCPFTVRPGDGRWTGPDRAAADELMERSGTRGAKVRLVVHGGRPFEERTAEAGRRVVAMLDRLGFDASLRVLTYNDFWPFVFGTNAYNAGLTMWGADYPAASQYVAAMGACKGTFNIGRHCDKALSARMAEATELQLTDPAAANDAWADLDRAVVRAAAVIPFSTIQQQDFVSHRVGNLNVHPLFGPLVAQMWVQ